MISKHLEKSLPLLKVIEKLSDKSRRVVINEASRDLILAIVEICQHVLSETFVYSPSEKFQLASFRKRMLKLTMRAKISRNLDFEKKLINYRGNAEFISFIISIAIKNMSKLDHSTVFDNKQLSKNSRYALKFYLTQIQNKIIEINNILEFKASSYSHLSKNTRLSQSNSDIDSFHEEDFTDSQDEY